MSLQKEFYKLKHKKKYTVILILGLMVIVGRYGISALISRMSDGVLSLSSNIAMEVLPFITDFLIPIIIFMAATDLISSQKQEDTLKADFLRPVTRAGLLLSKVGAILIMGIIYMVVFFAASLIAQLIFGGGIRFIFKTFLAYLIDIVPLINITLFAVFINLCVEASALSMFLSLALYAAMKYLSIYNGSIGPLLFTSYSRWHNLLLGTPLPFFALLGKMGIIFGTMLILTSVSYIMIEKKSL